MSFNSRRLNFNNNPNIHNMATRRVTSIFNNPNQQPQPLLRPPRQMFHQQQRPSFRPRQPLPQNRMIAKQPQKQQNQNVDLQKQKDLENQKQIEIELKKQQELEQQKVREIEHLQAQVKLQLEKELIKEKNNIIEIPDGQTDENGSGIKTFKRKWPMRRKISKFEIQKKRNERLSKLLQPKNAFVILNEIVKNLNFNIENFQSVEGPIFKATVVVDGIKHEGFGVNKGVAKNNASENALKNIVRNKKILQHTTKSAGGDEPMEISNDEINEAQPLAWQQFASFALYKLLSSWGEDPTSITEKQVPVKKPAKKLPANAHLLSPLMLMNQMLPQIQLEELPGSSNGISNTFIFRCEIDGKSFVGSGTSKKSAKRQVALDVCKNVLGVVYPTEPTVATSTTIASSNTTTTPSTNT